MGRLITAAVARTTTNHMATLHVSFPLPHLSFLPDPPPTSVGDHVGDAEGAVVGESVGDAVGDCQTDMDG